MISLLQDAKEEAAEKRHREVMTHFEKSAKTFSDLSTTLNPFLHFQIQKEEKVKQLDAVDNCE